MYCPSCGAENGHGLRYCKRCGENLSTQPQSPGASVPKVKQSESGSEVEEIEAPGINVKRLTGMFWAIGVFGFISLMALFGSMIPLTIFGGSRQTIIAVMLFGSLSIVGIARLLIGQLSRLITMAEDSARAPRRVNRPTEQSYPQVAAPPRSVSSVTEHTTRSFDHSVYNEPRASE